MGFVCVITSPATGVVLERVRVGHGAHGQTGAGERVHAAVEELARCQGRPGSGFNKKIHRAHSCIWPSQHAPWKPYFTKNT